MKILLISFFCFSFFPFTYSQADSTETNSDSTSVISYSLEKTKPYRAGVFTQAQHYPIRGYLTNLNESSITILPYPENIRVTDIKLLKFRTKGRVAKGLLIGALSGFALGGLIGLAQGDEYCRPSSWCIFTLSAEDKAILLGAPMSVVGLTIGGIIANAKISIPLGRSQKSYQNKRLSLKKYLLR